MDNHSRSRIEVAHEAASIYSRNRKCIGVGVIGSVARGHPDQYSDLDLLVIWDRFPDMDERLRAFVHLSDAPVHIWTEDAEIESFRRSFQITGGLLSEIWPGVSADPDSMRMRERFHRKGLKVGVIGLLKGQVDCTLARLAEADELSDLQMLYRNSIHRAIPLFGPNEFEAWRATAQVFGTPLAERIIHEYAVFSEDWWLRWVLADRQDRLMLRLTLDDAVCRVQRLILAGNRINFPDTRFKWAETRLSECAVKPPNVESRIGRILSTDPIEAVTDTEALVLETLDMLEHQGFAANFPYLRSRITYAITAWEQDLCRNENP